MWKQEKKQTNTQDGHNSLVHIVNPILTPGYSRYNGTYPFCYLALRHTFPLRNWQPVLDGFIWQTVKPHRHHIVSIDITNWLTALWATQSW